MGVRAHAAYDTNKGTKGGLPSSVGAPLRQRQERTKRAFSSLWWPPVWASRSTGRPQHRHAHTHAATYRNGARREACTACTDTRAHMHTHLLACVAARVCLCAHTWLCLHRDTCAQTRPHSHVHIPTLTRTWFRACTGVRGRVHRQPCGHTHRHKHAETCDHRCAHAGCPGRAAAGEDSRRCRVALATHPGT